MATEGIVRDARTRSFGGVGPEQRELPSLLFCEGETPSIYDLMTLGQRTRIAIFEMAHEGHEVEISPYWLLDLRTMYEVEAYCSKCRMSMHLDLHGEEVKHG